MSEGSGQGCEAHDLRTSKRLIMPWVGTLDLAAVCADRCFLRQKILWPKSPLLVALHMTPVIGPSTFLTLTSHSDINIQTVKSCPGSSPCRGCQLPLLSVITIQHSPHSAAAASWFSGHYLPSRIKSPSILYCRRHRICLTAILFSWLIDVPGATTIEISTPKNSERFRT